MNFVSQQGKKIEIHERRKISFIRIENINYIKCNGEISTFNFVNKRKQITVSRILKKFDKELEKYSFARSTHNILVNTEQILELKISGLPKILLKNGEIIPVSRRKIKNIKRILSLSNTTY